MTDEKDLLIHWYGNAAVRLQNSQGQVIYIDPWLDGNPGCPLRTIDVKHADWVMVTHGHPGHFGNSVDIAQITGARYIAHETLCEYVASKELLPRKQLIPITIGTQFREATLETSFYEVPHPPLETPPVTSVPDQPNCFIQLKYGGYIIGHAGDAIFDQVSFIQIHEEHKIDVLFLPMSGNYERAIEDALSMICTLNPTWAIPVLRYDPEAKKEQALRLRLEEMDIMIKLMQLKPGESISL